MAEDPTGGPSAELETVREYFEDTFRFKSTATVVKIDTSPDYTKVPDAIDVQLDRTIFYPQGGGQPTDTGKIFVGEKVFNVAFVGCDDHVGGVIHHYGTFEGESFAEGDSVDLAIDEKVRVLHSKLHTAGHLLDVAMGQCGYGHFPLGKGYHFPESTYDEYDGKVIPANRKKLIADLQVAMDKLIQADIPIVKTVTEGVQHVTFGKAGEYHPSQDCGGTHLDSTGQIGPVKIRKIKVKKGLTRVYKAILEPELELPAGGPAAGSK